MKDVKTIIQNKSLILSGGNRDFRMETIDKIKSSWKVIPGRSEVFVLKENIKNSDQFIKAVVKCLPVTSPLKGVKKEQMGWDQVNDYFMEWPHELKYDSALIIIPELYSYYKDDKELFFAHLKRILYYANLYYVVGACNLKLMVTLECAIPELESSLSANVVTIPSYLKKVNSAKSMSSLLEVLNI